MAESSSGAALPRYRELPATELVGYRHAWQVYGDQDELGRLNLLGPAQVAAAAGAVRSGQVFNLDLPLTEPDPPWDKSRSGYQHHVFEVDRNTMDDYLDRFYLQKSTQWDGLRHIRAGKLGFYGGFIPDQSGLGPTRLGIQNWAEHGIVGRGVLVDVARHLQAQGRPLDPRVGTPITVEDLQAALAAQRTELVTGDILMVRTGYLASFLAADATGREAFSINPDCPGLHAGEQTAEFLWDSGVSAVVADNPAVEVVPGSREAGSLHRRLIPLLGFALGELFVLDELADACAADGRYTSMFVGSPLNLPGGVGSPGNAVAIR